VTIAGIDNVATQVRRRHRRAVSYAGMHYFAAVYEAPLIQNDTLLVVAAPVKVQVVKGPRHLYPLSNSRAIVPFSGEAGEEAAIWPPPPIELHPDKRYVIVTTRTQDDPGEAESACRSAVERVIAILGLLSSPTVFSLPMYVGWISEDPRPVVITEMVFSKPQHLDRKQLEKGVAVARNVLAANPAVRDRFDLVARLFNRAIGSPPTEEAFLWAWMCLEVFPMLGTQKYRLIAPYLAEATGQNEEHLFRWLNIRALHELRSKLVHSGQMGLSTGELYVKLTVVRGIVYTVLRSMCGLPYDGELERVMRGGA
jgi:hypothetical protein